MTIHYANLLHHNLTYNFALRIYPQVKLYCLFVTRIIPEIKTGIVYLD
jgi:hypothetical protein